MMHIRSRGYWLIARLLQSQRILLIELLQLRGSGPFLIRHLTFEPGIILEVRCILGSQGNPHCRILISQTLGNILPFGLIRLKTRLQFLIGRPKLGNFPSRLLQLRPNQRSLIWPSGNLLESWNDPQLIIGQLLLDGPGCTYISREHLSDRIHRCNDLLLRRRLLLSNPRYLPQDILNDLHRSLNVVSIRRLPAA